MLATKKNLEERQGDMNGLVTGLEILDAAVVLGNELQRMVLGVSPVLSTKSA